MRPAILLSRPVSPFGEAGRRIGGMVREGKEGWRDKSSAVGLAAGGWFCSAIRAVSLHALLSLCLNCLVFSPADAPSHGSNAHD